MVIRNLTTYDVADLSQYMQCGDFEHLHDLRHFDAAVFEEFWEETLTDQDGLLLGAFDTLLDADDQTETLIAIMGLLYEPDQYHPDVVYLAEQFWATRKQHTHSKASMKLLDRAIEISTSLQWPIHITLGPKSNAGMLWALAQRGFQVTDITLERGG